MRRVFFQGRSRLGRGAARWAAPLRPCSSAAAGDGDAASTGFHCGGFFVSLDPNVGLWHDIVDPKWRITFTDEETGEQRRIPYACKIHHAGPHFEFAMRFQAGYVSCQKPLQTIPASFFAVSGWEATLPLPFCAWRVCRTTLRSAGGPDNDPDVDIWRIDAPLGVTAGFHQVTDGTVIRVFDKDSPQPLWHGHVAMVYCCLMVLFTLATLPQVPGSWARMSEIISRVRTDPAAAALFAKIDTDHDGFITREELKMFLATKGQTQLLAPEEFLKNDGAISFVEFTAWVEAKGAGQEARAKHFGGAV